jgi:hypothetical protein
MSTVAPNSQLSSTPSDPAALLDGVGEWVEAHGLIALLVLLAIYLCSELGHSLRIPLWHDEVFTWTIAQAPTLRQLLHLTQTTDLNPPLSYLLTRACFHLFGVGTLQTRLPEIAGYGLALVCIFVFVRRRAGNAYGLLAAAILLSSRGAEPAIDGRPYGLLYGFGALLLVVWQSSLIAQERGTRARVNNLLLVFTASAVLLTHIFGLFLWASVVAAEAARCYQLRRIVPSRLVALLLPLAALWFYPPLLRNHAAALFPVEFQAHLTDILSYYFSRTSRDLVGLGFVAVLIVAVAGGAWFRPAPRFVLNRPEWVALVCILATPIAIIVHLTQMHASFFNRYGDIATLGLAVLLAVLVCRWTANRPAVAVCASIILLSCSLRLQDAVRFAAHGDIFRHTEPIILPFQLAPLANADLPLVINSGLVFVEMNNHESAPLLDRTFYLTGGTVAIHYTHANIFENMSAEAQALHYRAHVEPYSEFFQQHPHFYLLASDRIYPEDWMLRKLHDDGASLRLLGHVENSYRDHDLYEVDHSVATH